MFSNVGQESRNGITVQHVRSYQYQPNSSAIGISTQQLSAVDFYLDAATFLPVAEIFNAHPDNDAATNLPTEVDFSDYQSTNGLMVPMHVRKYQQGNQVLDIAVTSFSFNAGLSLSTFSIN